jgi:hypothetical protein
VRKFGLVVAAFLGVVATVLPARADAGAPACKTQLPKGPRHRATCTHGGDPAPPGIDTKHRDPVPAAVPATSTTSAGPLTAASPASVPCYGDGSSGNRVEAIYAVPAGRTDRFATVAPSIRNAWAVAVDTVFNTSAAETGGTRHVRWVTDAACSLVVDHVQLSSTGEDDLSNTVSELLAKGYNRPDRKYLVWMDADVYCGIGEVYADDTASSRNANNGGDAMFARVDTGCWGIPGRSVEAHELMHTLGGVQPSAPHATSMGHCWDTAEVMCYEDGSGAVLQAICPSIHTNFFDCNHDDYFSTAPSPSSYLATHWNTAGSSFLTSAAPSAWHLTSAGAPPGGLRDTLSVTSWGPGRLDVMGRGNDNALWYASYVNGAWQPWQSLGGVLTANPAIASWGSNRLDVFVRGTDGALWHRWYDGQWRSWESLGGYLTSSPAAASAAWGRVDVFVRGTDNALWQRPYNAGWQGWRTLGGSITADPAAISASNGQLDVYVRGTDNALWCRTTIAGNWMGWGTLGGALTAAPAAASWGGGRRDVFIRGTDNGWWQQTWDNVSWSGWLTLGTVLTSAPAAASWGTGRIDVLGIDAVGTAWDRWYG